MEFTRTWGPHESRLHPVQRQFLDFPGIGDNRDDDGHHTMSLYEIVKRRARVIDIYMYTNSRHGTVHRFKDARIAAYQRALEGLWDSGKDAVEISKADNGMASVLLFLPEYRQIEITLGVLKD